MDYWREIFLKKCLNFKQLSVLWTLICFLFSSPLCAQAPENLQNQQKVTATKVQIKEKKSKTKESINFENHKVVEPHKSWIESLFEEDERGVMIETRATVEKWLETDDYYRRWNLEGSAVYRPVEEEERNKYLLKQGLKFIDRRLREAIAEDEKGTTLSKIKSVRQSLRPSGQMKVNNHIQVKLKARILQGKANLVVLNPFFDWNNHFDIKKGIVVSMSKKIELLGIRTGVDYLSADGSWVASFNKQLTSSLTSNISSTQKNSDMAFTQKSDQKIELNFKRPF